VLGEVKSEAGTAVEVEEAETFLDRRENAYAERRQRISQYCQAQDPLFSRTVPPNNLIYNQAHNVSICLIAEVEANTWMQHFASFDNIKDDQGGLIHRLPKPPKSDRMLLEAWHREEMLSVVMVGHPYTRLVNTYYNMFVAARHQKYWAQLTKKILKQQRNTKPGKDEVITPTEFIRFVLSELRRGDKLDPHWRPQHQCCPFCLLQFSVYSFLEEKKEDFRYFFEKSGLSPANEVPSRTKRSVQHQTFDEKTTAFKFWRGVEGGLVAELDEAWSYKYDLEMLGYSHALYFQGLGLETMG